MGANTKRGHWVLVTIEIFRRNATLTYNHTQPSHAISNDEILESICTIIETAFCGSLYFTDRPNSNKKASALPFNHIEECIFPNTNYPDGDGDNTNQSSASGPMICHLLIQLTTLTNYPVIEYNNDSYEIGGVSCMFDFRAHTVNCLCILLKEAFSSHDVIKYNADLGRLDLAIALYKLPQS